MMTAKDDYASQSWSRSHDSSKDPFIEDVCLPLLLQSQNEDGGWGYAAGSGSRVEPTSWSLLSLAPFRGASQVEQSVSQGMDWLRQTQLPDASWPAAPGQKSGCWVTSLACLALLTVSGSSEQLSRGVEWLCDCWPAEGGPWWRIRNWIFGGDADVKQDFSLRGWSWTPGTSSWVEPTSYALILLRSLPRSARTRHAVLRRKLGEAMLHDRICPAGGWNCGNPVVYGLAGTPQIGPTVWALLALQDQPGRAENQKSVAWLECAYQDIAGPASLALAHLCLTIYGRSAPPLAPALKRFYIPNRFFQSVLVAAWAAMALGATPKWLQGDAEEVQR